MRYVVELTFVTIITDGRGPGALRGLDHAAEITPASKRQFCASPFEIEILRVVTPLEWEYNARMSACAEPPRCTVYNFDKLVSFS